MVRAVGSVPAKRVSRLLRLLEPAEDAMHALVAVLLVGLAIGLTGDLVADVVRVLRGQRIELPVVLAVLDQTLVLFIVAELLHTVRIMVLTRFRLNAEPFLVVGMIAGVRQVLVVTAESEVSFRWDPQGVQLTILAGLILAMALAILIWRRSTRRGDPSPFDAP
jgi:phosphate starvation-inducible membrane PsiE